MQNTRIVKQGQSLLDISLCLFGTAEAAFALALENNISVDAELSIAQTLHYEGEMKKIYPETEEPVTAITDIAWNGTTTVNTGGISLWAINVDFKVS